MKPGLTSPLLALLAATSFAVAEPPQSNISSSIFIDGSIDAGNGEPYFFKLISDDPASNCEKVPYLGVVALPVPEALAAHLELEEGVGLIIEHVAGKSPAEAAGIQRFDILRKLDDQLIVNLDQLRTLVRRHAKDDKVTLGIIRHAKQQDVEVTIAEHEVSQSPRPGIKAWRTHLPARDKMNEAIKEFQEKLKDRKNLTAEQMEKLTKELHEKLDSMKGKAKTYEFRKDFNFPWFHNKNKPAKSHQESSSVQRNNVSCKASYNDGKHQIDLLVTNAGKSLTVKDMAGKVVFEGPINNDEQRNAIPKDVQGKVHRLESQTQIDVQVNPAKDADAVPEIDNDAESEKSDQPAKAA